MRCNIEALDTVAELGDLDVQCTSTQAGSVGGSSVPISISLDSCEVCLHSRRCQGHQYESGEARLQASCCIMHMSRL